MAMDTSLYLVSYDIAVRSGLISVRYRIADGRFVLDNKDLSRVRLTSDEFVTGLQGVEKVSESEAKSLIAKNGFKMGAAAPTPVRQQNVQEEVEEQTEESEQTVDNENIEEE